MILEVENKPAITNPKGKDIERALKNLKSEGPSSFASLTSQSGDYVQVAGGKFTCLLEKRNASSGSHLRAYTSKPSAPFPDGSILSFSGGDVALMQDEWLNIERVVSVFIAFFEGKALPEDIFWREIDLN